MKTTQTTQTTGHTKGPWKYRRQYDGQFIVETDEKAICWLDRHFEPVESDARLIAAAPELKSALELALATIERLAPSHRGFDSTRGTKDVVLAALSKTEANP